MRSTKRSLCAAILLLEAVVLGLTTPVLIRVASLEVATALGTGLGLSLTCIVTAGLLRRSWAYGVGWAIQVAALALGLLVTMMFLLGVVFAALWATAYLLGEKIDREKAERAALEAGWEERPGGR